MLQAKDWVLIAGVAVATIGYQCLPHGQSVNPKQNLSLFAQSADAGAFLSVGFTVIGIGLLIVCISFFIPRRQSFGSE